MGDRAVRSIESKSCGCAIRPTHLNPDTVRRARDVLPRFDGDVVPACVAYEDSSIDRPIEGVASTCCLGSVVCVPRHPPCGKGEELRTAHGGLRSHDPVTTRDGRCEEN
jgi:hypothetical protein